MRIFQKAAVSMTAAGLLAVGALAGGDGSAFAVPAPPTLVTGCSAVIGTAVDGGFQPNCTATGGTIYAPTEVGVGLDTAPLSALIGAQGGQGLDASWSLVCSVNGVNVTVPGRYDVTTVQQAAGTIINLQTAVGSPVPNSCTVSDLMGETALPLTNRAVTAAAPFTLTALASAAAAKPGAVYQDEGAKGMLCADDTANGNAGSKIQAFSCLSDLAEWFSRTSVGQLVHNGDCLGLSGDKAVLARCTANNTAQQWAQTTVGGTLKNKWSNTCLTATSTNNGTQLTAASCGNGADQKWHIPAAAAAPTAIRASVWKK